jgi:hypothetical protein
MQHDTIANDIDFARNQDAARDQVHGILLAIHDERVPCIIAPVEATNNVVFLSQHINQLPFAFISPLSTQHGTHLHHKTTKHTSEKNMLGALKTYHQHHSHGNKKVISQNQHVRDAQGQTIDPAWSQNGDAMGPPFLGIPVVVVCVFLARFFQVFFRSAEF